MSDFKDLFSRQAKDYAQYRPNYPEELFETLLKSSSRCDCLWDCGTGNGQVAMKMAEHFTQVYATDPSQKQLDSATRLSNIDYNVASAESSGLADNSCDMVTVAQALHWFDFNAFHREVRRVVKPGGVIAVWCYQHFTTDNEIFNELSQEFYHEITAPYWAPERQHVDQAYADIPFPYLDVSTHHFEIKRAWTLDVILNYIGTWSSINTCRQEIGRDLIEEWLKPRLLSFDVQKPIEISWPLIMHLGNVS